MYFKMVFISIIVYFNHLILKWRLWTVHLTTRANWSRQTRIIVKTSRLFHLADIGINQNICLGANIKLSLKVEPAILYIRFKLRKNHLLC